MMKFFLVALSLIAVCHASTSILLSPPALKLASPLAISPALSPLALAAPGHLIAPGSLALAAPAPLALSAHSPLTLSHAPLTLAHAPLAYSALAPAPIKYIAQPQIISYAAPAIQPGYVAATRGSLHIAPLPGNTPLASHHLNLEPAPGTI